MNRVHTMAFRLTRSFRSVSVRVFAGENRRRKRRRRLESQSNAAQTLKPTPKQAEANPFAPEPAPPLPAGMTGSDANDPRAKLDTGNVRRRLKHRWASSIFMLLKKPDAFQLGSDRS